MMDREGWGRVETLFRELVAIPAAERGAALERVEGPELRVEMAALLDAHEAVRSSGDGFLQGLDSARAGALLDDSMWAGSDVESIGRYRIDARLGRGGMGVVLRGYDPRLDRPVAIKVLPAHAGADPAATGRLAAEARAASTLDHPNVGTVHEIGETDDGRLFIVMSLYEGGTLRDRIAGGPLSVEEVVALGVQLTDGLAAAHRAGIVHRDIKPENLLLDRSGRLRIVDFGLAKVLADGTATAGIPRGTAAYMSPEQTRGEPVDDRTDVWAAGAVLYEMLTGTRPFGGATESLVHAIRHDRPAPLSGRRRGVPAWLAALVELCLEKDRSHRPDAETVARALRAAAALPAPRMRARGWVSGASAVAAVGALSLGGDPAGRDFLLPATMTILPFETAAGSPEESYLAEALTEDLAIVLGRAEGIRVVSRASAAGLARSGVEAREIGARLGVDALLEGRVEGDGEGIRVRARLVDVRDGQPLWTGTYDRAPTHVLAIQEEIARAVSAELVVPPEPVAAGERGPPRSGTHDLEAYDLYLRGRYLTGRMSAESVRRGIGYFERAVERDPAFARPHAGIADASMWLLAVGPVEAHLPRARAAARRALELDPELSEAHYAVARIATEYDWEWRTAEDAFRRALELDPSNAEALHRYAHLLVTLDRSEEAARRSDELVAMDPLQPEYHHHLGWNHLVAGRPSRAVAPLRRALELDPDVRYSRSHLGTAYALQGRTEEAYRLFHEARQRFGANAETLANLAWLQAFTGDGAAARATMREADRLPGGIPAIQRAYLHGALGERERAFEWLERSLEDRRSVFQYLRDPRFGPLLDDPRYSDFLGRLGLEPRRP